ncbi:uncharacterized protein LOC111369517 [Olea europaea var. sylvestris]|uniref:uncharacterized protein LOC111369517 n=1 Tax=Olea europaea var. sylvestris TaxID=158386 RepID=UPI000C1D0A77|nr:uncharacterized protein LOC111369517 [Olea europaea var. sylvestris]
MADSSENFNGVLYEGVGDSEESGFPKKIKKGSHHRQELREVTLYTVFSNLINAIFFRSPNSRYGSVHLLHRIKVSVYENIPLLRDASTNSGRHVLAWARRGSPLRLLLVVSVGTILLLTSTGVLVFMLFFAAATFNAVVISLFMSLVAAGGFLALFFACVAAIYVGALSIAVCVISTATTVAIIAVLTATGWIGFFCTVWLVTKKSLSLAKHSLHTTRSAISSYNSARHVSSHPESRKSE